MALKMAEPMQIAALQTEEAAASLLSVPYVSQKPFLNLCWAACAAMVFEYYKHVNVRLCDIVSAAFGINCCATPSSSACDRSNWPENAYTQLRFSWQRLNSPFTFGNIEYEINAQRPINVLYEWTGGNGSSHVAVICGYYPNGDLLVNDPLQGYGRLSYQYVLAAYGYGRWVATYFHIAPINGSLPQTS